MNIGSEIGRLLPRRADLGRPLVVARRGAGSGGRAVGVAGAVDAGREAAHEQVAATRSGLAERYLRVVAAEVAAVAGPRRTANRTGAANPVDAATVVAAAPYEARTLARRRG